MRVTGVIAEYDPFHLGHACHLAEARRRTDADYIVVVMSSVFTQRGAAALLSPADRVRMALDGGADAVIALPAMWAVRDAEHFALGGVSLLHQIGCDFISFGAENDDLAALSAAADLLEHPTAAFREHLQQHLSAGLPHPAAAAAACDELLPGSGALLAAPNNTLALCYLRALARLGSAMVPVAVHRDSDYHAADLTNTLPSATAVRAAILRSDLSAVRSAMPEPAFQALSDALSAHRLCPPNALDQALFYRFRTMTVADAAALPNLSEGIEDRLLTVARTALSRDELLAAVKTRRYPYARLSRLCTHALLGFTQQLLDETPLPPAAWLLGFRHEAAPLLSHMKAGGFPLIAKPADYDRQAPWFQAECRAYDVWALGAGLPAGLAFTQGMVRR